MPEKEFYKVKFTPYREDLGRIMLRQTAGNNGFSSDERYRFYIHEKIEEPDFWIVQGKGLRQKESCIVAPENTLLLTTEPRSVLVYPQKYLNQFGLVCSCQEKTKHPNLVLGPPVLPWFVGYKEKGDDVSYSIDYDDLNSGVVPEKTKLLSVITSNKSFTKGHIARIRFVEKLKEYYGDKVAVFGRGFRDFDDKWDVLAPYKYHIAIENSIQSYYWTEKLSDSFLALTFPFYYGCPNVFDYFPEKSCLPIDINNFEQTVKIIDKSIQGNLYEERFNTLLQAKQLAIGKYNLFDFIASLCDKLDANRPKKEVILHPCRSMANWHNFLNYTITRNYLKYTQKIKGSKLRLCF